jgi:hypothetical protein
VNALVFEILVRYSMIEICEEGRRGLVFCLGVMPVLSTASDVSRTRTNDERRRTTTDVSSKVRILRDEQQ